MEFQDKRDKILFLKVHRNSEKAFIKIMLLILNKNRTVSDIWCMTDVIFIFYCGLFLPFYPHNSPKNKNFKKMNKKSGDITIFHKCTKNHDHLLSCFWDMACDGCNYYFSFWAMFCPFTPVTTQKMKMKKKWKKEKHLKIS